MATIQSSPFETIILTNDSVDPLEWPRLTCNAANQLALGVSELPVDSRLGLNFQGPGQIGSSSNDLLITGELTVPNNLTVGGAITTTALSVTNNIGIETTNPEHNLQIGNAANPVSLSLRGPDGNTQANVIAFEDDGKTEERWFRLIHDTQNNALKITSAEVEPIATFSRITGNVGIGTTSPSQKLEVNGTVKAPYFVGYNGAHFSTSNKTTPLLISRHDTRTDNEVVRIGVGDAGMEIHCINDEHKSRIDFRLQSTDTESGGGRRANDKIIMQIEGNPDGGGVLINGSLSKGSGSFLIDHPVDPLNKTLRHGFVESPEDLCLYRGKVQLNADGTALVQMPSYFAALTKENEATVNLTPIGKRPFLVSYEWNQDYTAFTVFGAPEAKVSYLVMANRDDPVVHQFRKPTEEEKGGDNFEKGKLLYPDAYGFLKENSSFC